MASSAGGTPAVPAITGRLPPTLFAPRAHFLSCNQLGGSLRNAGNGNRNACGGELFWGFPFEKNGGRRRIEGKVINGEQAPDMCGCGLHWGRAQAVAHPGRNAKQKELTKKVKGRQ